MSLHLIDCPLCKATHTWDDTIEYKMCHDCASQFEIDCPNCDEPVILTLTRRSVRGKKSICMDCARLEIEGATKATGGF